MKVYQQLINIKCDTIKYEINHHKLEQYMKIKLFLLIILHFCTI